MTGSFPSQPFGFCEAAVFVTLLRSVAVRLWTEAQTHLSRFRGCVRAATSNRGNATRRLAVESLAARQLLAADAMLLDPPPSEHADMASASIAATETLESSDSPQPVRFALRLPEALGPRFTLYDPTGNAVLCGVQLSRSTPVVLDAIAAETVGTFKITVDTNRGTDLDAPAQSFSLDLFSVSRGNDGMLSVDPGHGADETVNGKSSVEHDAGSPTSFEVLVSHSSSTLTDREPSSELDDSEPPNVVDVIVASSTWSASFIDSVDGDGAGSGNGLGVSMVGPDQLRNLPWVSGIDRIYIVFSEDVAPTFTTDHLAVSGTHSGDLLSGATLDFGEQGSNIGTVSLGSEVTLDSILVTVFDSLTDTSGNLLDGEWQDAVSTNSGDGEAGGQFDFSMRVLAGDVDNSDATNLSGDAFALFAMDGVTPTLLPDALLDLDSDGIISVVDDGASVHLHNGSVLDDEFPPPPSSLRLSDPDTPLGGDSSSPRALRIDVTIVALFGDDALI